jgi:flagellar M-ring protein FliF
MHRRWPQHDDRHAEPSRRMNAVLEGLKALGPARLVAMAAVAAGMLLLLGLLALRGDGGRMALLYADLDAREAGQIVARLESEHVANQVTAGGTAIMVPADQVPRLRVLLARDGLPSGGSIGYELLDKSSGLGASEFQQRMMETRGLEGELVRSIRAISGVRAARVHLVLPRREPFARDRQDAQASVLVATAGTLDRESVQAILNLVAGAVPGLHPKGISVIDSKGNVLARAGAPASPAAAAQTAEELRRATEQRLSRAVEEMLEHSLGAGHVRAEASVEMNFAKVQETRETYDPDGQVLRSTQTSTDTSKTTEPAKSVTVQNNLPNANADSPGAGTQSNRQEETNNYEISKTVRTLVSDQPQIKRISLAVMVDGVQTKDANGKTVWQPRSAEDLAHIQALVQSAVGYDQKRGDHVEVVSMKFADDSALALAAPQGLFGLPLDRADLMHLAQNGLLGLIGLVALLFVFRPMVTRLTTLAPAALPGAALPEIAGLATLADAQGRPAEGAALLQGPGGVPLLAAPDGEAAFTEQEGLVSLGNVDGQLRASSIRRLTELVDKHPEESLSIVRAWMQEGAA